MLVIEVNYMINFYYLINFLECGHFCIKYYLKKDKKKSVVFYDKQMMSLRLVRNVFKEYYKEVIWYKNVNIDEVNFRCISLIKVGKKYLHYIVIEKIKGDYVYYYDPLFLFLKKKRKNRFVKKWSSLVCKCS